MKIILDAFGGDNGLDTIVKAANQAIAIRKDLEVILTGKEESIIKSLKENNIGNKNISIVNADDVVLGTDDPTGVVKTKPDSSMMVGLRLLSQDKGDAFVSAGNTGALFSGATLIVKRLNGVKRAALAPLLPGENGSFMLIDSGANVICTPQMLLQFGIMGNVYMKEIMGIKSPKIGLLNVGKEETKGTELQLSSFTLLKETGLNFIGNIEAREVPESVADVVVTDGFTGNVVLKLYEGVAGSIFSSIKQIFLKSTITKLAAVMLKSGLSDFKKKFDYTEYGGTAFLGLRKPVFKAHGSSDVKAFKNAILGAANYVDKCVTDEIQKGILEITKDDIKE